MTPTGWADPTEPGASIHERDLTLDLVQVTETAALAAHVWVGRGDKNAGDQAAVAAMRNALSLIPIDGIVVIGEGEKDEAPMLNNGERIGAGFGPAVDVAVDPVDGTPLLAQGMPNAIAVLAASERGTMFDPSAVVYMDKLVTSRRTVRRKALSAHAPSRLSGNHASAPCTEEPHRAGAHLASRA
jgi:fructose-1,6-bisphosphatase II